MERKTPKKSRRSGAKFLVLEGMLSEGLEFAPHAAYESVTAATGDRALGNPLGLELVLTDPDGEVLGVSRPALHFPAGCTPEPTQPGSGLLLGAIADHEGASRLAVRVQEREIHGRAIGRRAPVIKKLEVRPARSQHRVRAVAHISGPPADFVRWFLEAPDGRTFPLVREGAESEIEVDLRRWAGSGAVRLRVQASSGFRTSAAASKRLQTPAARVTGTILSPLPDAECGFGERLSLLANLSDENGRPVDWNSEDVRWLVDGKYLELRSLSLLCPELPPGTHQISLMHWGNGKRKRLDRVEIVVGEQTPGLKAYAAALDRFKKARASAPKCGKAPAPSEGPDCAGAGAGT